ncbi:YmdB family metallophosphoesterase [Candidatus Saccharibacteria bacterium]|nr:MAG: YmdB family metallophosphoesterase [Candidatus Saccharibacteria bacterium]
MKLLYIGDVMAEQGMQAVEKVLPGLIAAEALDFVVAQAENVTDGKGMNPQDMQRLQSAGVQAFSGGNHTPHLLSLTSFLENPAEPVVGPANMVGCPGPGYKLVETSKGGVLVVSILGSIVGKQADIETENPLKKIDEILNIVTRESYVASVVNIHGDFSSEKIVFGHYLDGRMSVVIGDHWHVPTADAQVLPKGTAHMTDIGMCGSLDSSLGVTFGSIIPRWRDNYQTRNKLETSGRMQFNALLIEVNEATSRAQSVRHIREVW